MSLCINPKCPKPENPDNLIFCPTCGSELLLEGCYRVTRLLGEGGFGRTYQVNDRNTPKVLKVLIQNIDNLMARLPGERPTNTQVILQQLKQLEQFLYSPKLLPTILSKFQFDVAVVEKQHSGLLGMNVTLKINHSRREAEFFSEDLGNGVVLEMVAIPGGTFLMGSPDTEEGRLKSESPQHWVTILPFYIGKFLITQAQWRVVTSLPQVNCYLNPDPSYSKGKNLPVEGISWDEVIEFCARLSNKTKRTHRLPSEAEWEYACRAGTKTPFHFGKTITPDLANYDSNAIYSSGYKGIYRRKTTPVGSFQVANNFGLYDMHGNVWEWCADPWHENYQDSPSDGSVWLKASDSRYRLLRGGTWNGNPKSCRSASRGIDAPGSRSSRTGFRVVCECPRAS